ncbi:alpha/beta hydrolase [Rugosimonospora acidiphila]|uniref:Alpha/beta hydrolase n=1 Tax=Rugosimonospora acidiphila TaxID=556531 RepID=A0ABP9SDX3_9ACTN
MTSRDGTRISFLSAGDGPGLVVIPGNGRRAHHYEALARELSGTHRVHVIDRRGRGGSGPQGPEYRIDDDVDDALAVLAHTRSEAVFGHSYGGLVGLHLALRHELAALVVYEPGVSIGGSFDGRWLPEYTRLLGAGRHNAAMATFLKRTRLAPIGDVPMPVFRALAHLLLHGSDGAETRALMATTPAEVGEVVRLDSDGGRYARITSPTLLLGGDRTPVYLTSVLPELARIIPTARCVILEGLDHNAPDLNAPAVVADRIGSFLPSGGGRR